MMMTRLKSNKIKDLKSKLNVNQVPAGDQHVTMSGELYFPFMSNLMQINSSSTTSHLNIGDLQLPV